VRACDVEDMHAQHAQQHRRIAARVHYGVQEPLESLIVSVYARI
jgi:hypothetical protein